MSAQVFFTFQSEPGSPNLVTWPGGTVPVSVWAKASNIGSNTPLIWPRLYRGSAYGGSTTLYGCYDSGDYYNRPASVVPQEITTEWALYNFNVPVIEYVGPITDSFMLVITGECVNSGTTFHVGADGISNFTKAETPLFSSPSKPQSLLRNPDSERPSQAVTVSLAPGVGQALGTFYTEAGDPNLVIWPAKVWRLYLWAKVSAGSANVQVALGRKPLVGPVDTFHAGVEVGPITNTDWQLYTLDLNTPESSGEITDTIYLGLTGQSAGSVDLSVAVGLDHPSKLASPLLAPPPGSAGPTGSTDISHGSLSGRYEDHQHSGNAVDVTPAFTKNLTPEASTVQKVADQVDQLSIGRQLFVSLGGGQSIKNTIAISFDGKKWTGVGRGPFSAMGRCAAFGKGIIVAGGSTAFGDPPGYSTMAYSYDAVEWYPLDSSIFDDDVSWIACNGERWVALGGSNNKVAWSDNGKDWTGLGNILFTWANTVACNKTRWVAGGYGANALARSDDGETWTGQGVAALSECYAVAAHEDGVSWLAGGYGSGPTTASLVKSLDNGATWSPISTVFDGYGWVSAICRAGSRWIVAGITDAGDIKIIYSSDLETWVDTGQSVISTDDWGTIVSLCYNGEIVLAATSGIDDPSFAYSTTLGDTWVGVSEHEVFTEPDWNEFESGTQQTSVSCVVCLPAPGLVPAKTTFDSTTTPKRVVDRKEDARFVWREQSATTLLWNWTETSPGSGIYQYNSTGALPAASCDGVTPAYRDRMLVVADSIEHPGDEIAQHYGVWVISRIGSVGVAAQIRRAYDHRESIDFQTDTEVHVTDGTLYGQSVWKYVGLNSIALGTTKQTWRQVLGASPQDSAKLDNIVLPHGWPIDSAGNRLVTLAYDGTTRKVTITALSGSSFDVWVRGRKITVASPFESVAHDTTTGGWYFYHDGTAWAWSQTPWNLYTVAPTCYAYKRPSGGAGIGYVELHGFERNVSWHKNQHETEGTKLVSGGVLGDYTLDTDTDDSMKFSATQCVIADEDLFLTIPAKAAASGYTIFARAGVAGDWYVATAQPLPYLYTSYIGRNNDVGGGTGWTMTPISGVGLGTYVTYYLIATPAIDTTDQSLILIPGQTEYTTLDAAKAETPSSLLLGTLPFQEFVPIAQLVFRARSIYTTTGKAQLAAVTRLTGPKGTFTGSANSMAHNSLSGIQGGAPGDYQHITSGQVAAIPTDTAETDKFWRSDKQWAVPDGIGGDGKVLTTADDVVRGYLVDKVTTSDGIVSRVVDISGGFKVVNFGLESPRRADVDYLFTGGALNDWNLVAAGTWEYFYAQSLNTMGVVELGVTLKVGDRVLWALPNYGGTPGVAELFGLFTIDRLGDTVTGEKPRLLRSLDANTLATLPVGMEVFIRKGRIFGGARAVLLSVSAGDLDSTAMLQFSVYMRDYNVHDTWGKLPLGWLAQFADNAPSYAPGVTDVRYIDFSLLPGIDPEGTVDANMLGGGSTAPSTVTPFTRTVIQAPSTTSWAIAFDAVLPVPVNGQACCFGVVAPDFSQSVHLWSQYALNLDARTNAILTTYDGSFGPFRTGPVIDGGRHTYLVAFNTYQLYVVVDGVIRIQSAAISSAMHMPTIPLALDFYQTGGATLKISQAAFAV